MADDKKMEQNNEDDLSSNTLFQLYKAKANDFQKVFIALLAFALIFLFLIFFPYFSILEKNNNINGHIGNLEQTIAQHQNNIYYYDITENGTKTLQKVLKYSPAVVENETRGLVLITIAHASNTLFNTTYNLILNSYREKSNNTLYDFGKTFLIPYLKYWDKINNDNASIPNLDSLANQKNVLCDKFVGNYEARMDCNLNNKIQNLTNNYVQTMKQRYAINDLTLTYCSNLFNIDSSLVSNIIKWDDCNLNNKIQNLTNNYVQILNQNILTPIHNIPNVPPLLEDRLASLQKKFQILDKSNFFQIKINHRFFEPLNPSTLRQIGLYVSAVATNVSRAYNSALDPIRKGLTNEVSIEGNEIKDLNNKLLQLYINKTRLINDKVGIETRLNETQFPFGKLPLDLDQSVAAFPIALAIGFVVCVSLQCSTIRLRKEYHRWYKKKYPEHSNFTDQKVALIAPLWIDPISSKVNQISRFIILVTPFLIFILTIYLISYYLFLIRGNQNISSYFTSDNIWIYSGIYVLAIAFFIYGCLSIIIELRCYKYMKQYP